MKTPVVLLVYKREKETKLLLKALSKVKPKKVFVVADGPKNKNEKQKTDKVRAIINKNITWKCEINKIYSDKNLGLKKRVVSGLNQVFKIADKAIILEDDCIPDPSFFKFCDQLLEKYKNNQKIYSVSGNNFSKINTKNSYYFSQYFHSWGWATWRRAWQNYSNDLKDWPKEKNSSWFKTKFETKASRLYWSMIFDSLKNNHIDSWAYRWSYTHFKNNKLSIVPSVNLVKNTGIGNTGTHTKIQSKNTDLKTHTMKFPIKHPKNIIQNKKADHITERKIYSNPRNILIQLFKKLFLL